MRRHDRGTGMELVIFLLIHVQASAG